MSKARFLLLVLLIGIVACVVLAFASQSVVNNLLTETRIGYGWHVLGWLSFAIFCWFAYGAKVINEKTAAVWASFEKLGIPVIYSVRPEKLGSGLIIKRLRRSFVPLARSLAYYAIPEKESLEVLIGGFKIRPDSSARFPHKVAKLHLATGARGAVVAEVHLKNQRSGKDQVLTLECNGETAVYKMDDVLLDTQKTKGGEWDVKVFEALNIAEYKALCVELEPLFEKKSLPEPLQKLVAAVHQGLIELIPVDMLKTACSGASRLEAEKVISIEWERVNDNLTKPLYTLLAPTVRLTCAFRAGKASFAASVRADVFYVPNGELVFCVYGKDNSGGLGGDLISFMLGGSSTKYYADVPAFLITQAGNLIRAPRAITSEIKFTITGEKQFESDAEAARASEMLKEELRGQSNYSVSATAYGNKITAGLLKVVVAIDASKAFAEINAPEKNSAWRRQDLEKVFTNFYRIANKALI